MEYQNRKKALGVIDIIKNDSVQIKILAVKEKDYEILSEDEAKKLFPPNGFVFGASFLKEYPHLHGKDLIDIDCLLNHQVSEHDYNKDRYIVYRGSAKKHFVKTLPILDLKTDYSFIDLNSIIVDNDNFEGDFYGYTQSKIFGKFRLKNDKLTAAFKKRIFVWDLDECETVHYDGKVFLISEPKGESRPLDCMDNQQLFDWFRDYLKIIDFEAITKLNTQLKWKYEIPKHFDKLDDLGKDLAKSRLKRIDEKISVYQLSLQDLRDLLEKSDSLKTAFNLAIEKHKEEFKAEYENQLKEYRIEVEKQKKMLDDEISTLEGSKKINESTLTKLKSEIENSLSKIEQLNQNKERILADFSIIKEVLGNEIKINTSIKTTDLFLIENVEKPKYSTLFTSKDDFEKAIQFQLNKLELFPNLAKRIIDVVSKYKTTFIKDIKIAIAIIEATNNATYIIQNVEPDWLHFSNLWENGLGAIWQSAHENPDKLHFLILEDINMSSPECYGRPLFDMILGIRKVIPFGKSPFPKNLRILATVASIDNPEIGLPLNKATFNGWAAIGFKDDIYRKSEDVIVKINGFVDTSSFLNFIPDEFEADEIKTVVQQEYSNLFDSE